MIYLTNAVKIPKQYCSHFGFLASSIYNRNTSDEFKQDKLWLLDNDAFADNFKLDKWLSFLLNYQDHITTCIGVVIPDKVGDALETIRLFSGYWRIVHDLGYPVAFVSQDGITPEITPWDYFDVLFVGGTDDHKLGPEAGIMIAEAKERGKWVHVGRVNSPKRIKRFWVANSVDGTQLTVIGQGLNGQSRRDRQLNDIRRIYDAVEYCRNKKSGRLGTNGQYNICLSIPDSDSVGQSDRRLVRTSDDDN